MRTTVLPALKALALYIPLYFSGACMYRQACKSIIFKSMLGNVLAKGDSWLGHPWLWQASGSLLGLGLLIWLASYLRSSYKKEQFKKLTETQGVVTSRLTGIKKLWLLALVIVFSFLGSSLIYIYLPGGESFYLWLRYNVLKPVLEMNPVVLASEAWWVAVLYVIVSAGVMGVVASVYMFLSGRKHAPIYRSLRIYGKLNSLLPILWKSAKVRGFGLGIKVEDVVGTPADTAFTETVSSGSLGNGKKDAFVLAHRSRFEPAKVRRKYSRVQLDSLLEFLKSQMPTTKGKQILRKSDLQKLVKSPSFLQSFSIEPDAENERSGKKEILLLARALISLCPLSFEKVNPESLLEKVNAKKDYEMDKMFMSQIYHEKDGNLIPIYKLRENIQKTMDLTTSGDGYGENYLDKGDVLMALTFTTFGVHEEHTDEEFLEGSSVMATDRNTIMEYRKTWYHIFYEGLGRTYMFYHDDYKLIYDEWWTGSFRFLTSPLGLKDASPRRVGYVRLANGPVVAKIKDVQVPLKLFGSYNRVIDIYHPELAESERFTALLCQFSQFLTHQSKYRANRLAESAYVDIGYSSGDMDSTAH